MFLDFGQKILPLIYLKLSCHSKIWILGLCPTKNRLSQLHQTWAQFETSWKETGQKQGCKAMLPLFESSIQIY